MTVRPGMRPDLGVALHAPSIGAIADCVPTVPGSVVSLHRRILAMWLQLQASITSLFIGGSEDTGSAMGLTHFFICMRGTDDK